jgi:hypothetical protein
MIEVHIPDPCPRQRHEMSSLSEGLFCGDCSKVIVDFTQMTNDEIRLYLKQERAGQHHCGIFRQSQLSGIRGFPMTIIRFAAALLLIFGSALFTGCSEEKTTPPVPDDVEITGLILCEPPPLDSATLNDSLNHPSSDVDMMN